MQLLKLKLTVENSQHGQVGRTKAISFSVNSLNMEEFLNFRVQKEVINLNKVNKRSDSKKKSNSMRFECFVRLKLKYY